MRVDVSHDASPHDDVLVVSWGSSDATSRRLNLREDPTALDGIEDVRRRPHLRSFLAAVNGADSVFASVRCRAGQSDVTIPDSFEFSSSLDLVFADVDFNLDRNFALDSANRFAELLACDPSADFLSAAVRVRPCFFRAHDRPGFALNLSLRARGATPEQAELRWGFGLARIQQALLFLSRVVRHHLQK